MDILNQGPYQAEGFSDYIPGQDASEWLMSVIDWERCKRILLRSMRVRRHKKKRIDKKWEKRYGYRNSI